jgi:hypothetical protein
MLLTIDSCNTKALALGDVTVTTHYCNISHCHREALAFFEVGRLPRLNKLGIPFINIRFVITVDKLKSFSSVFLSWMH